MISNRYSKEIIFVPMASNRVGKILIFLLSSLLKCYVKVT